jgi:hypothetical protein
MKRFRKKSVIAEGSSVILNIAESTMSASVEYAVNVSVTSFCTCTYQLEIGMKIALLVREVKSRIAAWKGRLELHTKFW